MRRFLNILIAVPTEDTDMGPAMRRAAELARRDSAKLTLISTVEQVPKRKAKKSMLIGLDDRTSFLTELAEQYQSDDLSIGTTVCVGIPLGETVRLARRDDHDLLIVPEGVGGSGLGARTKHLLGGCPSLVWAIRPGETQRIPSLDVVDPDSQESGSLNHPVRGAPQDAIPVLTMAREVNLFGMRTVAQTGIADVIIGHTVERIIDTAYCSLLTVKPDGFVTSIMSDR